MKVATLNLNGLRSATKKGLLPWLESQDFDIICFQEVRMSLEDAEKIVPKGYYNTHAVAEKKGYSGASIWSKIEPKSSQVLFDFPLGDQEGRIAQNIYNNCVVLSMYFPSGTTGQKRQEQKYVFLDFVERYAKELSETYTDILICGDVNIAHTENDIFHHKANAKKSGFLPREREWMTRLFSSGWSDVFRQLNPQKEAYSWWTNRSKTAREKNVGWRIDYQIASQSLAAKATKSNIVDRGLKLSDHTAIVAQYDITLS